jgi:Predicted membrane protein (DUF2157)
MADQNPPPPRADQPDAAPDPAPRDPSRTGPVWVAGVGAFLIVAAAAVFVASQWDHIPDAAKLAAIGLLTGAFLVAGRALKALLPATAGAMFHLGAFLIPVDVGAVAVHLELDWPWFLLVEGAACTVSFAVLQGIEGSALLRWTAAGSAVLLAGGVSTVTFSGGTQVPAPGIIALAAVVALVLGHRGLSRGWAIAAGLAPLVAIAEAAHPLGHDAFAALGLSIGTSGWIPAVTGLLAGGVLIALAHRRRDTTDYVLGLVAMGIGASAGWTGFEPTTSATALGLAATFLGVELIALGLRRDPFWRGPLAVTAVGAELLAGVGMLLGLAVVIEIHDGVRLSAGATTAGALALLSLGWYLADLRRQEEGGSPMGWLLVFGGGWLPSTPLIAATAASAAYLAEGPAGAAVTMTILAAAFVIVGRPAGRTIGPVLAAVAPLLALSADAPSLAAAAALAAVLITAGTAVLISRVTRPDVMPDGSWILTLVTIGAAAECGISVGEAANPALALAAFVVATWIGAFVIDLCERHPLMADAGLIVRGASLLSLVGASALRSADTATIAAIVGALFVLDGVRRDEPRLGWGLAPSLPIAVVATSLALGLTPADAGLALTVAGVVMAGAMVLAPRRWELALAGVAGIATGLGLILSALDPSVLAHSVVLAGVLAIGLGALRREISVWLSGAVLTTLGIWLELSQSSVAVSDAYLAPVAAVLIAAGLAARHARRDVTSWVAYGPAVALLGGSALLERATSGSPWHALVAGAVGVIAVAVGGWRRLAAPLLLGTALVIGVVGFESIDLTRGVPSWAWLALGGSLLLATGIVMERREVGPLETGRRMVDVIHERFA